MIDEILMMTSIIYIIIGVVQEYYELNKIKIEIDRRNEKWV